MSSSTITETAFTVTQRCTSRLLPVENCVGLGHRDKRNKDSVEVSSKVLKIGVNSFPQSWREKTQNTQSSEKYCQPKTSTNGHFREFTL